MEVFAALVEREQQVHEAVLPVCSRRTRCAFCSRNWRLLVRFKEPRVGDYIRNVRTHSRAAGLRRLSSTRSMVCSRNTRLRHTLKTPTEFSIDTTAGGRWLPPSSVGRMDRRENQRGPRGRKHPPPWLALAQNHLCGVAALPLRVSNGGRRGRDFGGVAASPPIYDAQSPPQRLRWPCRKTPTAAAIVEERRARAEREHCAASRPPASHRIAGANQRRPSGKNHGFDPLWEEPRLRSQQPAFAP